MNQIATRRSQELVADNGLSQMSVEELRKELLDGLRLTASCLDRLASVVRELESRGDDLSDLKIAMMKYLRLIAYGQLLPEVVVRFSCSPRLIGLVGSLPLPEQKELSEGKAVLVAVYGSDGKITNRMVDPLHLVSPQVSQVFARGAVRTQAEQAVILDQRRAESKKGPPKVGDMKLDYERRCVTVGKKTIHLEDLEAAIKALKGRA